MPFQPSLELLASPALGQVGAKDRDGCLQRRPAQEPCVILPSLLPIWPIYASAEDVGEMAQRERVAGVKLHLQKRLPPVGRKRALADDESHNVADIEFTHGRKSTAVFHSVTEARGTLAGVVPQ